jgi:signal transduction histidine kinase
LSLLLVVCVALAAFDFGFYRWAIELVCCVIYVAIFMFAFSVKDYSTQPRSLYWGTSFLFTFIFEGVYFYLSFPAGPHAAGLRPEGAFFWISTQWFQAVSFFIAIIPHISRFRLKSIVVLCATVTVLVGSAAIWFPDVVHWLETQYRTPYLAANVAGIVVFYGIIFATLLRTWNEQPPYFARRSAYAIGLSVFALVGLSFGADAGPVPLFVFTYARFVALAVAYNANVTFTLHAPYRTLYDGLLARQQQLAEANDLMQLTIKEKEELLSELQRKIQNNSQLKETLEVLHATHEKLVNSAKLSAAGRVIAGISHDLNSPLAGIQSASSMLKETIKDSGVALMHGWERLDHQQRHLFGRVLGELALNDSFLDTRSERQALRKLGELAQQSGKPGAEDLAQLMVQMGLGDREAIFQEILTLNEPLPMARAVEPLATIHQLSTVILRASERASSVVGALHSFLRTGSEGTQRTVLVDESIRAILPLFQPHLQKGATLSVQLETAAVDASPEKLTQVWVNLLTNAFQASADDGIVAIAMRVEGHHVAVSVENDGPEIPPQVKERLFELFFTTKPAGEGTGLGLYVCRRICEELGGELTAQSAPGSTVFTVRLPLSPA